MRARPAGFCRKQAAIRGLVPKFCAGRSVESFGDGDTGTRSSDSRHRVPLFLFRICYAIQCICGDAASNNSAAAVHKMKRKA